MDFLVPSTLTNVLPEVIMVTKGQIIVIKQYGVKIWAGTAIGNYITSVQT